MEQQLVTFKLDSETWDRFKKWASVHGTDATKAMRYLIGECLEGRIDIPDERPEPVRKQYADDLYSMAIEVSEMRFEIEQLRYAYESLKSKSWMQRIISKDEKLQAAAVALEEAKAKREKEKEKAQPF
jgi:hypothetical protein